MTDNLFIGKEARSRIVSGVRKCAEAVGATMGSAGSNAIIEAIESPGYLLTNDGISILRSMNFADPLENIGKKILLDAVERANKQNGDGSSTATVITHAIIEEGQKYLSDYAPMDIKRSLEDCIKVIEESINKQKREISVDDVAPVATISAEDAQIGGMIQDIYKQIGKDGIIHWDVSKTSEDYYTIGNGITIDGATYASPYMCDADISGQNTGKIRLKNPKVLIIRQKISSANDFASIGEALFREDVRDLVVFCDDFEPLIINDLILTRAQRGFRIVLVKMPVLWKDEWYEDLMFASGAKIIDPALGVGIRDMKLEHVGSFGNILISKEGTYIDGIKDLQTHITAILEQGTDEAKLRASRLNTKTARYFVGAPSDAALSYRRLKVEDAISSAWQALHGGIVAGGGSALASVELPDTIGGKILKEALKAPARQIALNAGLSVDMGYDYKNGMGFDSRTKSFVNMFEAQIVDPALVVINACKNAVSVAATVLTARTITTLPRVEQSMPSPYVSI